MNIVIVRKIKIPSMGDKMKDEIIVMIKPLKDRSELTNSMIWKIYRLCVELLK